MTREEARKFLIDISYALGNMSVEYLTEKDGEKMREAIKALEQEPKTGHWEYKSYSEYNCSACGSFNERESNYCPECGAKME